MLSLHNVLEEAEEAGLRWLDEIDGLHKGTSGSTHRSSVAPVDWVLSDSDVEAPLVVAEVAPASFSYHADENRSQRTTARTARQFLRSRPRHLLAIGLVTLQVTATFLNMIEGIAGESWDRAQWSSYAQSGQCSSRMWEAHSGHFKTSVVKEATRLLQDTAAWYVLAAEVRTWSSVGIAFCLVSIFVVHTSASRCSCLVFVPIQIMDRGSFR